ARGLSLGGGAGRDRDLAVGQHPHGDAFERTKPGALDVVGDADADIAPFGTRGRLPRWEARVIRQSERAGLAPREVAARIDERLAVAKDEADGVGHLLRPDHVARAQLGAVEL